MGDTHDASRVGQGRNQRRLHPRSHYNPGYAADTVTNEYAAYSAHIGSGGSSSGSGSGGGFRFYSGIPELSNPTNLPGRVQIEADRLDMSLARFRTDGLLGIKAKELVGSAPYKLDSQIVDVDFGRSEGSLVISNIIQPVVRRFNGDDFRLERRLDQPDLHHGAGPCGPPCRSPIPSISGPTR